MNDTQTETIEETSQEAIEETTAEKPQKIVPVFRLQSAYIKNSIIESPNSPLCFTINASPTPDDVTIYRNIAELGNDFYEATLQVVLTTSYKPTTEDSKENLIAAKFDITIGGLFVIQNNNETHLKMAVGIDTYRTLFPFLLESISDAFMRTKFPNVPIENVDFEELYWSEQQQ
jgi:protein-export chaperone SecB